MITCDIDGPELYSWTEQRARKQYRCCECSAPILIGEVYGRAFGKWEGDINTYRQHLLCSEACMFVRDKFQGRECLPFGSLREWYRDEEPIKKFNESHWRIRKMFAEILRRERLVKKDPPALREAERAA